MLSQDVLETWLDSRSALVFGTAAIALVAVAHRPIWRWSRGAVTIAHEGGHALVALLTGRRLSGIRLHSDTSGVTVSSGRTTGPGMVLTTMAGYVAPSLLGLGGALLVSHGWIRILLWVSIALLAGVLVLIRNPYGLLSVVATGGLIFCVSWFASVAVQAVFAHLFAWFLLFAGIRPIGELQGKRRRGRAPDSDADQLARLTGINGTAWVVLFALVAIIALVVGGRLLVLRPLG
ncbi:M50 family metallopeptidase [Gandjariella thermophila]|uniref:Membrane protein n=1 Tax=Gandjariella thermophila TaxID=1931992 RepID=A0A4D4J1P2_9PSEU|nr:M50 family metallopeptidase [Gandjariella thermophila]GDY28708.1 membrane protein [Gandjariella thermophila]